MPIDQTASGRAVEDPVKAKIKERIEDEDARRLGIKCPKCDGTLIEADYESIKIDACDKCSGVWLDAGELAEIVNKDSQDKGWFGNLFS